MIKIYLKITNGTSNTLPLTNGLSWYISQHVHINSKVSYSNFEYILHISMHYSTQVYLLGRSFYNISMKLPDSFKFESGNYINISLDIEDIIYAFIHSDVTKHLDLSMLKNILSEKHLMLLYR